MLVMPDALFGLHVVLVMDEREVANARYSPMLQARLGEGSVIEVVAIAGDGRARRAQECVDSPVKIRSESLGPPLAWAEALEHSSCNLIGLRTTVVAVLPSAKLALRLDKDPRALATRDRLADALAARHVPITLLHPEVSVGSRLLLTRPYVGATGTVSQRIPAFAYQLRARTPGAAGLRRENVQVEQAGVGVTTRMDIPVHQWDAAQEIVGPFALVDEATDPSPLAEGVHFFRVVGRSDSDWLAVTADPLKVAVVAGAEDRQAQLNARWRAIALGSATPLDLVGLASTQVDGTVQWRKRSPPFAQVSAEEDSDGVVVPRGGMAPTPEYLQRAGRAVVVKDACGGLQRYGSVHLVFDHSRLGLQKGSNPYAPNVRQMEVYDALLAELVGKFDRAGFNQGTIVSREDVDRPIWEGLTCGTDPIADKRLRRARPMLGRVANEAQYVVHVAAPLLPPICGPAALSMSKDVSTVVREEYLPSHIGARAHALVSREPEFAGDARLDGVTVVFFAFNTGQLRSQEVAAASPGISWWGWDAAATSAGRVSMLAGFDPDNSLSGLQALLDRGAAVFVIPIALPPELADAVANESVLSALVEPTPVSQLLNEPAWSRVQHLAQKEVGSKSDAEGVAHRIAAHVLQQRPRRTVGGAAVRDTRFQSTVTAYDEVCRTGPLLEAKATGRGLATSARFDLFSPMNWLYDEGPAEGQGERVGSWALGRGRIGLGAQVLADGLIESSRPFGNRRSLGASSLTWLADGSLQVVAPTHLRFRVGGGNQPARDLAQAQGFGGGGQLASYLVAPGGGANEWLEVSAMTGSPRRLPLHSKPDQEEGPPAFRWLPAVQATGGFVMQGGTLQAFHRIEFWPYVLVLLTALVTVVGFSPWVTPWAVLTWLKWPERDGETERSKLQLSLSERATIDEAGRAAGRIVARTVAGEPEGVRAFEAGDSPNTILPLAMYSLTAMAGAQSIPQLVPQVRIRRAQQVPRVFLLVDAGAATGGAQGDYLRSAYTTICQVVARVAIESGAAVALAPLAGGDEVLEMHGATDEGAVAECIKRLPVLVGPPRDADDMAGCGLCVIASPMSVDQLHLLVRFCVGMRAQATRCVVVHPSFRPIEMPGVYVATGGRGMVLNRQQFGERGVATLHDHEVQQALEREGIESVAWLDRASSIPALTDALIRAMEGPA